LNSVELVKFVIDVRALCLLVWRICVCDFGSLCGY